MKTYVAALIIIVLGLAIPIFGAQAINQPPVASFTYSPSIPTPLETITFNASTSYDPDGYIGQYEWNFGDGNLTVIHNPVVTHSYPIDGKYTVELAVIDDEGLTSEASAVIEVSTTIWFRVVIYGTTIPIADAEVTVYYKTWQGGSWTYLEAPASSSGMEIIYDNMTQPDRANTSFEKYRNPGYTASILRKNASNIGFDIHPCWWSVYFKIKLGPYVAYWPNDTIRVYNYKYPDIVEAHDYHLNHMPYWDPIAGAYVLKVKDIPVAGNDPSENHPIMVGVFWPPPPQECYLTVATDPSGVTTIPGEGSYVEDTCVPLIAPQYVAISSDTRYEFHYWDVDGISQGVGNNAITVCMDSNHTATAHYTQQYLVTFTETGLSPDTTGTVLTVDGSPKTFSNLSFSVWADNGASVIYSYSSLVSSSISGKRFRLNDVAGPSSPITVTGPTTVTGNYMTQHLVTFAQSNIDTTAIGTIVTVNSSAKSIAMLPFDWWVDYGSAVTYTFSTIVDSSVAGKRFELLAIHSPSSPFIVTGPVTITGSYGVQFEVAFHQTGLDSTATGTVVTVNGNPKAFADIPYSEWVDSGAALTYVYNDIVLSTVTGKRFKRVSVSGPSSPITITGPTTVTGNCKIQYSVVFDQTGVGSDFAGTVVVVDGSNYGVADLPVSFWFDLWSSHSFSFVSPLSVSADKQYVWSGTSGLSALQSDSITITGAGSVTGNYAVANRITFDQTGVSGDFTGTVIIVDGTPYGYGDLPLWFMWQVGSTHNFAYQSPLVVSTNSKQYVWSGTSGLSALQSDSITVSTYGSIIGDHITQYYLTLATSPASVASPSGSGWYDANTYATISTTAFIDIVPGSSRYRFNGWTTADMPEITNPTAASTTVLMDKAKTVTANYVIQYKVTFSQTGVASDFTGIIANIDATGYIFGTLPVSFWFDSGSSHTFSFHSPLVVNISKQYDWISTTGLSTLQNGGLLVSASGYVTGNYAGNTQYQITFDQTGVGSDFAGTVVVVDGSNYGVADLPVSFWFDLWSSHSFSFVSPLSVSADKQYVWSGTSGLSALQSDSITVSTYGSIIGDHITQYYLTLATSPASVASPSGSGWYDANTYATISTTAFIDIVPGSSRYRFNGWTTADMPEITNPTVSPSNVYMDKGKTVTATYAIQYSVVFDQTGVGSDFAGTVVVVDGSNYGVADLPHSFWWDNDTGHTFTYQSPLIVTPNAKQYTWTATTGLSALQSDSIVVSSSGTMTGNYQTQYYLTVDSPYDSPIPSSGWFNAGTGITASVTSPAAGPSGTRYVSTGWTGTGSVPTSGTTTSATFSINEPSSITWTWKTQYYLTVETDPLGLITIPGEDWYDASTSVPLDTPSVSGYDLLNWDVDGVPQGDGVNPITIIMTGPRTATAHYLQTTIEPLLVSITPLSTTLYVGQSVTFTSNVSGGTLPYTYQWYLDGTPVSGATSDSWTFTPSASGIYYVHVRVTDANSMPAQSETARVEVISVPVGGYSVPMIKHAPTLHFAGYFVLLALFGIIISSVKRKRK